MVPASRARSSIALAGYAGIANGCLGWNRVAVARAFPLITLAAMGAAAVYYWFTIDTGLPVFNLITTMIALASSLLATHSTVRWYLRTDDQT